MADAPPATPDGVIGQGSVIRPDPLDARNRATPVALACPPAGMNGLTAVQARDDALPGQGLMRRIQGMRKPVTARIDASALGGRRLQSR